MPFNGSGTAQGVGRPQYPPASNEIIYAAYFVTIINDILSMLSTCLTRDGQSTLSQNIPANAKKFTGLADGTMAGDSVAWGQSITFGNLTFTGNLLPTQATLTFTNSWDFSGGTLIVPTKPVGTTTTDAASTAFVEAAVTTAVLEAPIVERSIAALSILIFTGA